MTNLHTHPGDEPHEHDGAVPGHTHDAATPAAGTAAAAGPSPAGLAVRVVLTVLGAAGLIGGAFLPWAFGDRGINVEYAAFYDPQRVQAQANVLTSAGGLFILLGLLALLGLAFETGWLTRVAGGLGLVGWVLVLITLIRLGGLGAPESGLSAMQIGLWLILLGSIAALIGGFFGSRRGVAATY